MNGLTMDFQLTLPAIQRRAEEFFGAKEIVSRLPDRSFHRYTYADFVRRSKQLTLALRELGVQPGERVATFAWNHHQHLEAYFGVPNSGAVLHTLNLRLHPNDLTYIVNHADDQIILVDKTLWPLFERFQAQVNPRHVIVISEDGEVPDGTLSYEKLLAAMDPRAFRYPDFDEHQAAAMCYTSGTTGRPKGVLYSHRALVLHSLSSAMVDTLAIREADVILPVVPMFHVNAWGLPFTATMVGAGQVLPGPYLDPPSLLEDLASQKVTFTAGVPTIWLGILAALDQEPHRYDLSRLRAMVVGGSAAPSSMIRGYQERHGLNVLHAWGMTETAPIGTVSVLPGELLDAPADVQYESRAKQGRASPLVEIRAQVRWRVDQLGRARKRPDGPSGGCRGGGDRRRRSALVRASAGGRRVEAGADGHLGRAAGVPGAELREMVAAGYDRVRRADPENGRWQVSEVRPARAVQRLPGPV